MSARCLVFVTLLALCSLSASISAHASEQISFFDVEIDVQKNGDIIVTETISVTAQGRQIRRGIFRDLPRYYEKAGDRLPYRYDVLSVQRNGEREPFAREREGNAFRIRIGDADVFLSHGEHVYEIEYAVKNQVRYFSGYDEVYWNATGNYWNFPIAKARATVRLPGGANATSNAAYTGASGAVTRGYEYSTSRDDHVFTTTGALGRGEGLTVAVGFDKGVVDPPSAADKRGEWLTRHASAIILSMALSLLGIFYWITFNRVGRDPLKGPVFPRYEPPEGYSPAAVHHIFYRRLAGAKALIATLLHLAVHERIKIDAKDKKKTKLTYLDSASENNVAPEEKTLLYRLFNNRRDFTLGDGYDSAFTSAYTEFKSDLGKKFGAPYFKWNTGFLVLGVALTIVAVIVAARLSVAWTFWHTGVVGALVALSIAFSYFLPAPTPKGQTVRTEVEGFRLYLKTAEKLQLNAVQPGSQTPPPMSVERYELFLPFAIALGVEAPWTRHFERLLPDEARDYQPRWASSHGARYNSVNGLNKALMASMTSGVASALPKSSSSSGSGGGGFSGGGGGGGGGGGW